MPQPKKAARFGGNPAHHNMILANLATELIRHGRITTTLAKAKNVQPLADKMITFGKRGDVHARRQALRVIRDKDVVHKLFADVGPAFAERNGGYTRVLKIGARKGDAAPMAIIELVEGVSIGGEGDLEEQPRRRWSLRRRKGSMSASARETAEDRQAAVDRGEDLEPMIDPEGSGEMAEAVPAGALSDDEDAPQADPAEVEARLAAQDSEADADPAEADEVEGDEPDAEDTEVAEAEATGEADDADASDETEASEDDDKA
jgi:large subunit ribosomal protein L17